MKKIFTLMMICALVLMTGCGGSQGNNKPAADKPAADKPEIKLGMITHLNATEQRLKEIYDELVKNADLQAALSTVKFYKNLTQLQLGLESGDVNEISLYSSVANYVTAKNDKFALVPDNALEKLSDSFCFAVRKDDTALKTELDGAIESMKADGTLDKLIKEYITDVNKDDIPTVELPMTEGAQTIKFAVTGDLPPLDYVSADGKPAGFNTAMIAEIAKRIGRNVEIVDIDSGARAAALSSKKVDVLFWVAVPNGNNIPTDIDKPEGVELSAPYFSDSIKHLKLK